MMPGRGGHYRCGGPMAADALPLSHLVWVQMYKPLQSVNLYVKPTSTVKDGPRAELTSSSMGFLLFSLE